jgi:hypothetical protein
MLKEEPYTQKEAEAAVGIRTDNGTRPPAAEDTVMSGDAVGDPSQVGEH